MKFYLPNLTLPIISLIAALMMATTSMAQNFDHTRTALLVTDPQNDFLAEDGAVWALVQENVTRLGVRENIKTLLQSAKSGKAQTFVSPHFYFPHDANWNHRGALQNTLKDIGMFTVSSNVANEGFEESGADFYDPYKKYILDGKTLISSPHKIYGPESNDLAMQLRKRDIDTVIIAGFAANLCTDSHMRELIEQGFQVIMVNDAVGAPGEEAYEAALLNYSMIANAVWSTKEAAAFLRNKQ